MNFFYIISLVIIFGIGCAVRTIPILVNYPFPIGYDSINYYLPVLLEFKSSGLNFDTSFPIYIYIVYFFSFIFFSDIYFSFNFVNVVLFGLFGVSTFLLTNIVLKQPIKRSFIFTIFVIFQLNILRISWDLYRDLLSITLFNLYLIILNGSITSLRIRIPVYLYYFSVILLLTSIVFSDRMIGILTIIFSFIFSIYYRQKHLFYIISVLLILFSLYLVTSDQTTIISSNSNILEILINPLYDKNAFSQIDVSILLISLYGPLFVFFIIGFIRSNYTILKIPTYITIVFSLSWIFIPNYEYIVPERWIIFLGFFISLFAIHGFYYIVMKFLSGRNREIVIFSFIFSFIIYGILFIVMPYGSIYSLTSLFHEYTGFIFPLSMSFNSIETSKNLDLIKSIEWLNQNTENSSLIMGSKHWRGFFDLFLSSQLKYDYIEDWFGQNYSNILKRIENNNTHYFFISDFKIATSLCTYNTQAFSVLLATGEQSINKNNTLSDEIFPFLAPVYKSGDFYVYNTTKLFCNS